jgi:protein TonB
MPSATLLHSFPVPLGRRGSAAALVIGLHVLLVAALLTGIAVHMPEVGVTLPPPPVYATPKPETPLGHVADSADRWTFIDRIAADPPAIPEIPPVTRAVEIVPPSDVIDRSAPRDPATAVRVLRSDEPSYPAAARRLGEEGVVLVRVLVGVDGHAERVEVASSSGSSRLDEAAVVSVRRWLFRPATSGSGPVASWTTLRVVFRLTT